MDHLLDVLSVGRADALAIASILHYSLIRSNGSIDHHIEQGNTEFLKQGRSFSSFGHETISSIKRGLVENNLAVRIDE